MEQHVIVCGMGEVGFRAVNLLLRLGERVAVVDRTPRDAWVRELEAAGVQVVRGDARDLEVLQAAGIERAKALLALTDQDMVNVQCALEADQRYTALPTIVRVFASCGWAMASWCCGGC